MLTRLRRSLLSQFLLVLVPLFVVASLLGYSLLLRYDARTTSDQLAARIGNAAARTASAFVRHKLDPGDPLAHDLIAFMSADRAIRCVELRSSTSADSLFVTAPFDSCQLGDSVQYLTLPIAGRAFKLHIAFSDEELIAAARTQRRIMYSVVVLALLLAVSCTAIGFRFTVSNRLRALLAAIRQNTQLGNRIAVAIGRNDELGAIMREFNAMVLRETEREAALRESHQAVLDAQAELQSEQRFRHFAASASDWYWEMDAQLRFSYFSERFTDVTGVAPEVLLGKTREETGIPDVDPAQWHAHLEALKNHRPFRNFTHPRVKDDGATVWLSISGTPVYNDSGTFIGYRGVGTDITERTEAQRELMRARDLSEQATRTKSQFLASMSHEIRTPINGVLAATDLLLAEQLTKTQNHLVETVDRSARSLLGIISDILDFSKVEAGMLELEEVPLDPHALIDDVVEMVAVSAHAKKLELASVISPDLPREIMGDPVRLRQILTNLLGNAVKFTSHGHVVVSVSCSRFTKNEFRLRFDVSDSGIGIPEHAQPQIFDSFAQADRSTTRRFGGSGLGLAICRQLVELMGGEISFESAVEQGSTFWFTIPCKVAQTEQSDELVLPANDVTPRALIVCRPITARALASKLTIMGVHSVCVDTPDAALTCIGHSSGRAQYHYDMVLIDDELPESGAAKLCESMQSTALSLNKMRKLLVCTMEYQSNAIGRPQSSFYDGILFKPVRASALRQVLAGLGVFPMHDVVEETSLRSIAGTRVLLAEDHPVNQDLLARVLQRLECHVTLAANGHEVLRYLNSDAFDVVLMDCDMPEMDGFEATRALRERERISAGARVPVIALTANALAGDRERCIAVGMDDYLSKPVESAALRDAIARWSEPKASSSMQERKQLSAHIMDPRINASDDSADDALDTNVIDSLLAMDPDGKNGFMSGLIDTYRNCFEEDFNALRSALRDQRADAGRKAAHRLKSASANLGAKSLAGACAAVEAACSEQDLKQAEAQVSTIEQRFHEAVAALQASFKKAA